MEFPALVLVLAHNRAISIVVLLAFGAVRLSRTGPDRRLRTGRSKGANRPHGHRFGDIFERPAKSY